jgi:hypothetical protein
MSGLSPSLGVHIISVAKLASRDISVDKATAFWLKGVLQQFRFSAGGMIFVVSTWSRSVLGSTQSPVQCALGTFSPEVKQSGREAARSPPTSTEFKKTWIYTSTFS